MDFRTENLLKIDPFDYINDIDYDEQLFTECIREELLFHYENNDLYKRFCDNKSFVPEEWDGDEEKIPPVHVSVFKELGTKLSSVPRDTIKLTLQSSATSGVPSSVPIDKLTAKRQAKAMVKVIGNEIGNDRKPFLVMDVDPTEGFREILGARYAAVTGYLNFSSKTGYFLKVNKENKYYFDLAGIKSFIGDLELNESSVVFGFTYILYSEVIKPLYEMGEKFILPKGSKIIHIGGWKKLEAEKITKEEFNKKAAELFGIDELDVIDIYGFTEQMGINYPECKCGFKHTSLYSHLIIRDISTKEVLGPGKEGLLEFVSPIPHSYPGNVVITDDLGFWDENPCPFGRPGKRFKMTGRLKKAEIRGCGDVLSNKLKFADDIIANEKVDNKYRVLYCGYSDAYNIQNPISSLKALEYYLIEKHKWLIKQPIDALIGLIAKCATKWNDINSDNPKLLELKMSGLGFLASWCTVEHLNSIITEGLDGNRHYIDTFLPVSDDNIQFKKAVSRGLACHWLAGNVQVLGMFVLIESILCKNVNLLKVSSRDDGVFTSLLEAFEDEMFTTKGGYTIYGNDLLDTIALVYYDHTADEIGKEMSRMADIRIAWGGKDAVTTVSRYTSKFDCQDLIMGPKLSFSVISKESLEDKHSAEKLARKVAVDASVFDQTGCASSHNIFIERGSEIEPKEFAELLAKGMQKVSVQIPKGDMSAEQISQIHSIRGVYDFKGTVYGDNKNVWTVLYSDDIELCKPIYSRVVFVHPVDDINDVIEYVDDSIQTIGLAAVGEKAISFAINASNKGALRFPVCGRMLNFDSPWDGMYLTDRMVKWVTLGGPVV